MSQRRQYYFVFLICSILVYELPYFLTLRKTGWSQLPAVVDYPADQMLYLNLSAIHYDLPSEVVNPWYGNRVPAVDVAHLRFPITFLLFRLTHAIFRSWTLAMLVWAGTLAGLTFAAAAFCLRSIFPDNDFRLTITAAFGLLVLQSPLVYLADLVRLPSVSGIYDLRLPYMRFAFPQVIVPVVFAYLGLQTRALKSGSKGAWVGMALLQFAACCAFPYVLPIVAVATAITILIIECYSRQKALRWPTPLLFAAACGVLDIGYLLLAGLATSHGNIQFGLHFRPEMIIPSMRPYVLLLLIGAGLALASPATLAAKATVAGLALSNALFAFSDVLFPVTSLMDSHVNYIVALTSWLPLIVVLWPGIEKVNGRPFRIALGGVLISIALWQGFSSYRSSLPVNTLQAEAVKELGKLALTPKDLVVAPAQFSDDISCWVPLLSRAKVLFTRDAENILSSDSIRGEQAFRQALYLELGGINRDSLISFTEPGSPDSEISRIELFGEIGYQSSPLAADHVKLRTLVRQRLEPSMARLDSDPASAQYLFHGYDRIVVVDSISQPVFKASALAPWLEIKQEYAANGVRIWICQPKTTT